MPSIFLPPLTKIGYIKKKKTTAADVWIYHHFGKEVCLHASCFVFIELLPSTYVPFEVLSSAMVNNHTLTAHFRFQEDIYREYGISQKSVYMEDRLLSEYCTQDSILMIRNFDVYANNDCKIGRLVDEVNTQDEANMRMLVIEANQNTIHLPYNKKMLVSIDRAGKKMHLQLDEVYVAELQKM